MGRRKRSNTSFALVRLFLLSISQKLYIMNLLNAWNDVGRRNTRPVHKYRPTVPRGDDGMPGNIHKVHGALHIVVLSGFRFFYQVSRMPWCGDCVDIKQTTFQSFSQKTWFFIVCNF